jgi:ribosomal protein L37E
VEPIEREEEDIRAYVLSQSPRREKVTHAEKMTTRRIYGESYDIWDVWTSKDRWWVITRPTNLYSQTNFVSMEVAFTYHLGIGILLAHRNAPPEDEDEVLRMAGPWRRWQEADKELNEAVEAEDYQSVGVRCREALLSLTNELADPTMVPAGEAAPKRADFVHWTERIADHVAGGGSLADVRSHLKMTAKSAWDLAGWLTHAKASTRTEAGIVLEAVSHVMTTYTSAVFGKQRSNLGIKCPVCGSNRVFPEWDPETRGYTGKVNWCDACGYGQPERKSVRRRSRPGIGRRDREANGT